MFARVLVVVGALSLPLLQVVWLPITAAGLAGLAYGIYLYFAPHIDDDEDVSVTNPFELGPAITFGLLYGLILLVSRAAQMYFGETGVYVPPVSDLELTHPFQTGNMLVMHKQIAFGFYFYFFSNPLRPQMAEEVCLS